MSVRKRGKVWAVTVYNRHTHQNDWIGTRPAKGTADGDPEYEAKALEHQALTRRKRPKSETCDSFANRWIDDYPRPHESTNKVYRERVRKFAKDFEGRSLNDLDAGEVERWALDNKARVHFVRAMFTDARRARLIDHNPFMGLRMSRGRGRKDIVPPSEADVEKLAEHALEEWGEHFYAFVMCAAYTGIRPGELSRLQWSAVDWENDEITLPGDITKNGQPRTIVLLAQAREALLLIAQDAGRVFESVEGRSMSKSTWAQYWKRTRDEAGFPSMHFYVLRHFAASYLLNTLELAAQDVAQQLGHTDGGVLVSSLYGHPDASLARTRIKRANQSRLIPLRSIEEERKAL